MKLNYNMQKKYFKTLILITIGLIIIFSVWVIRQELLKRQIYITGINSPKEKIFSDILDFNLSQEIVPAIIAGSERETRDSLYALNTYHYDFSKIEAIHTRIADVDTKAILQRLFSEVTSEIPQNAHNLKWLFFSDFISRRIRHPPLTQPMYSDKTMVTHPIVLLLLGEGRCGHVARVIVDVALSNNYEARLVQLAAHLVAEVKWEGSWHFIDANADFPLENLKALFDELPSLKELSKNPYLIDQLPARGWMWSEKDYRTTTASKIPYVTWYPGKLLNSSMYFGNQILHNKFSGDPYNPRKGLQYWYKNGTVDNWQFDKYYGWNKITLKEELAIPPVFVEFHPTPMSISAPTIIYQTSDNVVIPVRFFPIKRIKIIGDQVFDVRYEQDKVRYDVHISSRSRGWDYDFRNYRFMPRLGKGDVAVTSSVDEFNGGMLGVDVEIQKDILEKYECAKEVFIEVVPKLEPLQQRGYFAWPSREVCVEIYSAKHCESWNYEKK